MSIPIPKVIDKLKSLLAADLVHAAEHKELIQALMLLPSNLRQWLVEDEAPGAVDSFSASRIAAASDFPDIDLDPSNHKFETFADAASWVAHCTAAKRAELEEKHFKKPDPNTQRAAKQFMARAQNDLKRDFRYELRGGPDGGPIDVALFADFGTGLPHSRHIAKQITRRAPHYAFHLGDVYYTGSAQEYQDYFVRPLSEMLDATRLFNLAGNHDRYSGNANYYADMDRRRDEHVGVQQQESSYFRLVDERYQIIGIDTNTFEPARFRQQEWLEAALEESRERRLTTILLSSEHPYDHVDPLIPHDGATDLYKDVAQTRVQQTPVFDLDPSPSGAGHRGAVNLWCWGNVHYAALFEAYERKHRFPFVGACVGHGGYPYYRMVKPIGHPFIRWIETAPRYPRIDGRPRLRPAMGNNGFCMMRLHPDRVELSYVDWLGHARCEATLSRSDSGALAIAALREFPAP